MNRLPVIAIVGRPNVGKSSLLNALCGRRISIVQDMPGVTRDRISTPLLINDRFVELVDTGGFGFVDPDQLTDHIAHQIELAMARADLVLFIVDCGAGLTSADETIARMFRQKNIKTLLVANKADGEKSDPMLGDFARLGLGTPVGVSALRERNLDELMNAIANNIDLSKAPKDLPSPEMMVAIIGKRNAGKSTLVNAIAGFYEGDPERVIVSEIPGTTRDSVDVRFEKDGKTMIVIDTAGVRKKRHMVTDDIQFYSFHRAQRSIRRADVVLLLIDATEPVSEPDKKLAQYVGEEYKPVVLVVNKWDLARDILRARRKEGQSVRDEDLMQEYRKYLDEELKHLNYAPIAFITAKEGKNVQVVLNLAQNLYKQANFRLTTHKVNTAVRQILVEQSPSTPSGRRARIYYATQIAFAPPTLVVFVNNPLYFSDSYQRFLINRLRDVLPFPEVPIKLIVRERQHRGEKGTALEDVAEDKVTQINTEKKKKVGGKPGTKRGGAPKPRNAKTLARKERLQKNPGGKKLGRGRKRDRLERN